MAQCPKCGNAEPELLTKNDEGEIACSACNAQFEKDGSLLPEPKKDPPKPKAPLSKRA